MQDLIEHLKTTMPNLPDDNIETLVEGGEYKLTSKDASTLLLLDDGDRLDYYYDVVEQLQSKFADEPEILARIGKAAGNW